MRIADAATVAATLGISYFHYLKLLAMSATLWIVLSFLLAEIGYIIVYNITGGLIRAIFDVIAVATKQRVLAKSQPYYIGLVAGCGGIFAALFILSLVRKHATLTANWYFIATITIIFYGQVRYFGINLKSVYSGTTPPIGWPGRLPPIGWPGRFNAFASDPMERAQFAYYLDILQRRDSDPESSSWEFANGRTLREEAYKWMRQYMLRVSFGGMLGILAGLPLYYWLFY